MHKTKIEKVGEFLVKNRQATNRQLNQICFRYGSCIFDLRQRGWIIETIRLTDSYFAFKLIRKPKKYESHKR